MATLTQQLSFNQRQTLIKRLVNASSPPHELHLSALELVLQWSKECPDECWPATCATDKDGYPVLKFDSAVVSAKQLSYAAFKGPIAKGASICHTCDNRKCWNPYHLKECSHEENMADKRSKGRGRNQHSP